MIGLIFTVGIFNIGYALHEPLLGIKTWKQAVEQGFWGEIADGIGFIATAMALSKIFSALGIA